MESTKNEITRFALLRHEVPDDFGKPSHWDLLLESDENCWTWVLETLPGRLTDTPEPTEVDARRLPDHRKHYLDYEGPVSGARGFVRRELEGSCEWVERTDGRIHVRLRFTCDTVDVMLEQLGSGAWRMTTQ